ncbi:protein of unknown function (DU1801) [Chryseobacterium oranimense]|uniref:YdhG-like domain-containing protein n=1 Tax=Chryseobacterium oranimense TaxID=421058 RepID=A0A1M5PDN6_9FLAO|nr:DUF1801 domain-containing protein [Chryseobacterium oranimense]SHG99904.1 protein of unknown function (DU1801) [Chryseobacterium oranimense]
MNPIQEYFYRIDEPERSTLLFLRKMILESDPDHITETFSFGLPFFKYKKKMLCYLYYSKKYKRHYISFYHGDRIHYPELIQDGRKKFKILLIDMDKDLPVSFIMNIIDDIKQYI